MAGSKYFELKVNYQTGESDVRSPTTWIIDINKLTEVMKVATELTKAMIELDEDKVFQMVDERLRRGKSRWKLSASAMRAWWRLAACSKRMSTI